MCGTSAVPFRCSSGSTLQKRWNDFEKRFWPKWKSGGSGESPTRGRWLIWERYAQLLRHYPLLLPRITHSWAGQGVPLGEPAAVILLGGIWEEENSVGHGDPKRARSRKRWIEAKRSLQPTESPLLGVARFWCQFAPNRLQLKYAPEARD
jgi:hypothetical protein